MRPCGGRVGSRIRRTCAGERAQWKKRCSEGTGWALASLPLDKVRTAPLPCTPRGLGRPAGAHPMGHTSPPSHRCPTAPRHPQLILCTFRPTIVQQPSCSKAPHLRPWWPAWALPMGSHLPSHAPQLCSSPAAARRLTYGLGGRHGLSRERGLVDRGAAVHHHAIHRHAVACAQGSVGRGWLEAVCAHPEPAMTTPRISMQSHARKVKLGREWLEAELEHPESAMTTPRISMQSPVPRERQGERECPRQVLLRMRVSQG